MNRDEVQAVMSKPISRELLQAKFPARIAYVGLDGEPRVVPIGFYWNGEAMVVCTTTNAAKVPALRRNPRVAITIDTNGFPPQMLLVRGAAAVEVVEGVPEEYIEGGRRVLPADQFDGWLAGVRDLYSEMARVTIAVDWAKLIDFETTLPKPVEELLARKQSGGE